jgi:hypothetical protein
VEDKVPSSNRRSRGTQLNRLGGNLQTCRRLSKLGAIIRLSRARMKGALYELLDRTWNDRNLDGTA